MNQQQSGAYTQCRFPLSEAKRKCRTLAVTPVEDPEQTSTLDTALAQLAEFVDGYCERLEF